MEEDWKGTGGERFTAVKPNQRQTANDVFPRSSMQTPQSASSLFTILSTVPQHFYRHTQSTTSYLRWKTKSSGVIKLSVSLSDSWTITTHREVEIPFHIGRTHDVDGWRDGWNGLWTTRRHVVVARVDQLREHIVDVWRTDQLVHWQTHQLTDTDTQTHNSNTQSTTTHSLVIHPSADRHRHTAT